MKFLVTGGQGFLGAYIVKDLIKRKIPFSLLDVKKDDHILQQVLPPAEIANLERFTGDVSNFEQVNQIITTLKPTHVIHLAALQVPACRADPVRGGLVNVVGHLNIFESVKRMSSNIPIVYASSAAVAGFATDYSSPLEDDTPHTSRTHYGIFKQANEGNSRIYWQDNKISSIGLRPHTIYGVGRELGITSGPTKAIKAAVLGKKYEISFSGSTSFLFIEDAADIFVRSSLTTFEGAHALNMRGEVLSIEQFMKILAQELPQSKDLISLKKGAGTLPLAFDFNQKGLDKLLGGVKYTSLVEGIRKTAKKFEELQKKGLLKDDDLRE